MAPVPSSDEFDDIVWDVPAELYSLADDIEDRHNKFVLSQPALADQRPPSQHPVHIVQPKQPQAVAQTSYIPPIPQHQARTSYGGPPPAKKPRPNAYATIREDDDLPEIRVDANGQYRVAGASKASPTPHGSANLVYNARQNGTGAHVRQPSGSQQAPRPPVRPPPRPALGGRNSSSGVPQVQRPSPLAQSVTVPPGGRSPSVRPTTPVTPVNGAAPGYTRSSSTAVSPSGGGPSEAPEWERELADMTAQLVQLRKQNESLQAAKTAAEEMQYAKAGEVSNVRRLMDQQTKANQDALNKVKAEKEELIRAKEALEYEMRARLDRMKSDMAFERQQLATKGPQKAWPRAGPSQLPLAPGQTPARTPTRRRPGSSRPPSSPVQPTPARRVPQFNGFSNSFTASQKPSPVRNRKQVYGASPTKGKENESQSGWGRAASEARSLPPPEETQPMIDDDHTVEETVPVDFGGVLMPEAEATAPESQDKVEVEEENFFGLLGEGVSWRDELHHAVFKHRSLLFFPETSQEPPPLTIQLLLTVTLPEDTTAEVATRYREDCADILAAFGIESSEGLATEEGSSEELSMVGQGLSRLASIFCNLGLMKPLALCFDLLAYIAYHIPAFRHILLAVPADAPESPPTLLTALGETVVRHLRAANVQASDVERRIVAETCLTMLETLAWRIAEDDVLKLSILTASKGFVATLLDPAQPPWLVERSARLFCLFSSHPSLFRSMLVLAEVAGEVFRADFATIPTVDSLCHFLVHPQPQATFDQTHATFQSVLCTLTSLSIAHADGPQLLQGSRSLIPSLVRCLRSQSTLFWDEDESILDFPNRHSVLLQTLHLGLTLFHYVGLACPLGQKLQNATRAYNGITHAFILALGRLSYADSPEWLSPENAKRVEDMRDQARDLFEHVIEVPEEGDQIWAAYQDDGDESGSATEAEQEPDEPEQPDIPMDED